MGPVGDRHDKWGASILAFLVDFFLGEAMQLVFHLFCIVAPCIVEKPPLTLAELALLSLLPALCLLPTWPNSVVEVRDGVVRLLQFDHVRLALCLLLLRLRLRLGLLDYRRVRSLLRCPLHVPVLSINDECAALEEQLARLLDRDHPCVAPLDVLDLVLLFQLFIWIDFDSIDTSQLAAPADGLVEHEESDCRKEFGKAQSDPPPYSPSPVFSIASLDKDRRLVHSF